MRNTYRRLTMWTIGAAMMASCALANASISSDKMISAIDHEYISPSPNAFLTEKQFAIKVNVEMALYVQYNPTKRQMYVENNIQPNGQFNYRLYWEDG